MSAFQKFCAWIDLILKNFRYYLSKMVALPKLPNCCACASLKTGTLIIGSLNLVASVIGILASIGCMAGSDVSATIWHWVLKTHWDELNCWETIFIGFSNIGCLESSFCPFGWNTKFTKLDTYKLEDTSTGLIILPASRTMFVSYFYRTQVSGVQSLCLSVCNTPCWDLTDEGISDVVNDADDNDNDNYVNKYDDCDADGY